MTLRHRLSRLENAVGAARVGDGCPVCGWPGPDGWEGWWEDFDWTVADLETLRAAYTAAEAPPGGPQEQRAAASGGLPPV